MMRHMRGVRSIVGVGLVGWCLVAPAVAWAAEPAIAIIDPDRVFENYEKTKQLDKQLEGKWTAKQADRDKRVAELRKMKDDLELMSEKGRGDQQAALDAKIKELQVFDQQARETLKRERDDIGKEIVKEIERVVQTYAQQHGYSVVISNRAILYGDKSVDITDPIIKALNGPEQKGS